MLETRTELVSDYCQAIKSANNEAAKKEIFLSFLTTLFGERDEGNIIAQFANGAERGIANIRRDGKRSGFGRADTQYGNVIIEFENNLERTGTHAELQLKEYISGNWNSGVQGRFSLIASDCLTWRIYTLDYDSLFGLGALTADELKLQKVSEFTATPEKANHFYLFLDRYLFGTEPVPATLETIRDRFGSGSDTFQSVLALMHRAYTNLSDSSELEVAKIQWEKFLSIAYGRFEASESIFLIHSYLSVLAKMLAYSVISSNTLLSDDEIERIVEGEAFKRFNVANFTDNDFFRWTASQDSALKKAFSIIADEISQLDFSHIPGDILKGVYQELVDDDTRHALGEHYTPDWLCAKIVAEMNPQSEQKILDPSCGSGSFLKAVANHLIRNQPNISASELNSALYGIDVHPLSVQITKATLLMAYGKRLTAEPAPLTMNVFLANSLLLPEEDIQLMGHVYTIAIDEARITVPDRIFNAQDFFARLVSTAEQYADNDHKNGRKRNRENLEKIFKNNLGLKDTDKTIFRAGIEIYQALLAAKKANRNGIWAYILANTFAPVALKNQFDMVLGNPPWLTFKDIVANDYQKEVRAIAQKTGCSPWKETLITQLEMATIFVGWSLSYFLKDGGKLAFVMPRSIFVADQHSKLREGKVRFLKIHSIWDLQAVTPLFKMPACVLIGERGKATEATINEIRAKKFSGHLSTYNTSFDSAKKKLSETDARLYLSRLNQRTAWSHIPICFTKPSPYIDSFNTGPTLFPRSLCFVEFDQEISGALSNRIVRVRSSKATSRDAKKPWKSISLSGTISTKYLFITALANNLVPFGLNGFHMVILPFSYDECGKPVLLTPDGLEDKGDLGTAKWLRDASKNWDKHKTERSKNMDFNQRLNFQNDLLKYDFTKKFTVLYTTSGTNAVSTVVSSEKFELPFIPNAVTYYFTTNNKSEALYLCAYFNSAIPNQLIKPFQAQGIFGARHITKKILEIPLPVYENSNPLHREIATLAQTASDKVAANLKTRKFDQYGNNMDARECGLFRNKMRAEICEEIKIINDKVAELLNI